MSEEQEQAVKGIETAELLGSTPHKSLGHRIRRILQAENPRPGGS